MNAACKRALDIFLAVTGLLVTWPFLTVISLMLWIEAPGHIIFSQERLGEGGRRFNIYKFRKFPVHLDSDGRSVTVAGDARMTPLGRILERLKFDELPQLWNILKGDMSFVGPRPETPRFSDLLQGEFAEVLNYKPGIFGPNQIEFRNESEMYPLDVDPEEYYRSELLPRKVRNDLAYFREASCIKDLQWIVRGVWVSIVGAIPWRRLMEMHLRIIVVDVFMVSLAWLSACGMRFGMRPSSGETDVLLIGLWLFPLILIPVLAIGGCYEHPVRSFSLSDALRLLVSGTLGWLLAFLFLMGFLERGISVLLAPLGWLCLIPLLALPRVSRRLLWERFLGHRNSTADPNLLIYGAGQFGMVLAHWLKTSAIGIRFLGFLDDAPELHRRRINGYRVLGRAVDVPVIHEVHHIDEVWVSFLPSPARRNQLQAICDKLGIRVTFIPDHEPFSRFSRQ